MIHLVRHQAIIALVAVLVFFTSLGSYALFNEDEPKNAACAAEMMRRGDWIVPTFNEDLRTDKPILTYWFMLVSYGLFGVNEFAARFASSVFSVGTTLLTYHLGRKLYSAEVGFFGALILCTCLFSMGVGRSATPDAFLVFFVTLTMTAYVWVVSRQHGGNFNIRDLLALPPAAEPAAPPAPPVASAAEPVAPAGEPITSETVASAIASVTNSEPADNSEPTPTPVHNPLVQQFAPASWKWAAPMYAAMGFAVLAKGPVGIVLPLSIVVLFLLVLLREHDLKAAIIPTPNGKWWRRWFLTVTQVFRPRQLLQVCRELNLPIGLGIAAAIAVPWYLAVGIKTNGAWLTGFLWNHNLDRALAAKEGHSGFPLYQLYYLVVIHFCCFPWSVFLPVAVYQWWQRLKEGAPWRESDLFLGCWIGVWLVVFSIANTKLPNYILPMYPAVALTLARYFYSWEREEVDEGVYSFNLCCRALGIAGIVMVVGLYIAAYLYIPSEQWIGLIGAVPIIGAYTAVTLLGQERRKQVTQTLAATAAILATLLVIAVGRVGPYQDTRIFVAEARQKAGTADISIASYGFFDANLVFYSGTKVRKLETPREAAEFLAGHPHAFIIAKQRQHNELMDELTGDVVELSRHRNFLRREERILLGRN